MFSGAVEVSSPSWCPTVDGSAEESSLVISEEMVSIESLFNSFPDEPMFHLLIRDARRALSLLHSAPWLFEKMVAMISDVARGEILPEEAHELIGKLRAVCDDDPDGISELEKEQGFPCRLAERAKAIVQREKKAYLHMATSAVYQRLYGRVNLKTVCLPLFAARCLLCTDGTLNLGMAREVIRVFLPPKPSRDAIEEVLTRQLRLIIEEDGRVSRIETLCPPLAPLGERIVRSALSLEETSPVTAFHIRLVCLSSFITWYRQERDKDCYAKAFLSQLHTLSFDFFFHDFSSLLKEGKIERTMGGTKAPYIPLQELPFVARQALISRQQLRDLWMTPSVRCAFLALGMDFQEVQVTAKRLLGAQGTLSLGTLFKEIAQERPSLRAASLYLEAPGHNIIHQLFENSVVSMLVHPGCLQVSNPDFGERLEMAWHAAIDWLVTKRLLAPKDGLLRQVVIQQLRLLFSPSRSTNSREPVWELCWQKGGQIASIESARDLGDILLEIVKSHGGAEVVGNELTGKTLGSAFVSELERQLHRISVSLKVPVPTVQESPLCFPSSGHRVAAVTSRYFSDDGLSSREILCDGDAVVRYAMACQERYGVAKGMSLAARDDTHAFRMVPALATGGLPDPLARVRRCLDASTTLYSRSLTIVQSSAVVRQMAEGWISFDSQNRAVEGEDRTTEVFEQIDDRLFNGRSYRSFLLSLCLSESWSSFPSLFQIHAAVEAVMKQQRRRKACGRVVRKQRDRCDEPPPEASLAEAVGEMTRQLASPLLNGELALLIKAVEKTVRDGLFTSGLTGRGMLLPIGDSNFRAEIAGKQENGIEFLWFNPREKRWMEVFFWGVDGWTVAAPSTLRIVDLAPPLAEAAKRRAAFDEQHRRRKEECSGGDR